jgi:NitT/TauT family transport system substrate-binding protein
MLKPSITRLLAATSLSLLLSGAAGAADKLTFMNDWLPGGDKAIPFYGMKKGIFAAEGLEVKVETARGSSEALTKIGTGVAEVGSGGLAALLQARAETSIPVKAIAGVFTVQPDALFTIEGSPIKSLKDVEGRKVATATFTSSNVIWPLILKNNNIDVNKVTLLKVDPAALVGLLATGQVDATINWTTASPPFIKALSESKKTLKMLPWGEYGFEGYGYSLFASEKLIAEKPDVLKRFTRAYIKTIEMALKDKADVARTMKEIFPEMDEALVLQQFETIIPLIDNAISKQEGIGKLEKTKLATTWEWTAKAQDMPLSKLDPEKAVDRSFLP